MIHHWKQSLFFLFHCLLEFNQNIDTNLFSLWHLTSISGTEFADVVNIVMKRQFFFFSGFQSDYDELMCFSLGYSRPIHHRANKRSFYNASRRRQQHRDKKTQGSCISIPTHTPSNKISHCVKECVFYHTRLSFLFCWWLLANRENSCCI